MAIYKEEHFGICRKIVASITSDSWQSIPHAVMSYEADVTGLLAVCKKHNGSLENGQKRVSLNTVMMYIFCRGLEASPKMNCTLKYNARLVRGTLQYHDEINISLPMIFPDGRMMTVNLYDMGGKSLDEMTELLSEIKQKAENTDMEQAMYEVGFNNTIEWLKKGRVVQSLERLYGSKVGKYRVKNLRGKAKKAYYLIPESERLTGHDIEQGTVTVSNIGSARRSHSGMCLLLEIIPPQVTAIAVSAVQRRPVVTVDETGEERIEIRSIMPITVAIDHRALDYGDTVGFYDAVERILKNPECIFSENRTKQFAD